jgi:putative membrane protein
LTLRDLPTLNAALNAASATLLLLGYVLIRAGRRRAHATAMIAALACSAGFLASYLVYHAQVGSVRFPGRGAARAAYLAILLSHTVLAVAVLPLVIVTVGRAARRRYADHKRVARVTLPLWAYVSVTGVVVYWMLYRLRWDALG